MVGRKEVLRTLPVFLALNVACTNGISAAADTALSAATPGAKRDAALAERLDMGNPRRKTLLQKNDAVKGRSLLRVRGGLSRGGAKDNKELRLPGSPIDRALAVNGVSWAAVVGGVLWSRAKMAPEGGVQPRGKIESSSQHMVAIRGQGENIMHTTAVVDFSIAPTGSLFRPGVRSYDPNAAGAAT